MTGLQWNNEPFNSRQVRVIAVLSLMTTLSTLALFLRFLSRKISHATIWYDDYAAVAALVCTVRPRCTRATS